MIRVVVVEDQALVRGALAALLGLSPRVEVVAQAATGADALALIEQHAPDVVVSDIEMPGMSGLDLAVAVHAAYPRTRVLIVTTFGRPGYLRRALQAGVSGYVLKDASPETLIDAVERVHAGQRAIDPALAVDAWGEDDPLTGRERQVLRLADEGMSGADIAGALSLSEGTVRNYLSEAISKLGARNRIEAVRMARAKGWL